MRILAILLIAAGLIALVVGSVGYTRRREVARVGPISASVREHQTLTIPRVVGGVVLLAGIGLLVASGRRRSV